MKSLIPASIAAALPNTEQQANRVAVAPFVKNEELFGIFEKIISILKARWPRKTAQCVAHLAGVSERAVQFWLARTTGLSLENVIALLRTEAGFEILCAVMGDSKVDWWVAAKNAHAIRENRKKIAAFQKELDAMKAAQRQQIELL